MDTRKLIQNLQREFISKKKTLAVAESCTGGLLAESLTDIPDSSQYFTGGVVVYSNRAKTILLKANPKTLKISGAVSHQVARVMARNIRQQLKTSLGISITGIAGPGGGSVQKPVGLVYIGMSDLRKTKSFKFLFSGNRSSIREQSVKEAVKLASKWARLR